MIKHLEELRPLLTKNDNDDRYYLSIYSNDEFKNLKALHICFELWYNPKFNSWILYLYDDENHITINPDVTLGWLVEFINVMNKVEGYNIQIEGIND